MQNTTWIFQAAHTRDHLFGIRFPAYMLQVVNPFLVLVSIPLMEHIFNPYLRKHKLFKHPLKRMLLGGAIAGIAFFIAGCVEIHLEVSLVYYTIYCIGNNLLLPNENKNLKNSISLITKDFQLKMNSFNSTML